jgi:PAS domain S-box-containing protein
MPLTFLESANAGLKSLWHWLTDPSPDIREPDQRIQAKLLSSLLVGGLPIALFGTLAVTILAPSGWGNYDLILAGAVVFLFAIGYRLSRTPHYKTGALVVIITASLTIFASSLPERPIADHLLDYLIVPILLSSIILSRWTTLILALLNIVGMIFFVTFVEHVTWEEIAVEPVSFMLVMVLTLAFVARYARELESIRQTKFRALFEQTHDAVFLIDLNGHYLDVNRQACELLGYTRYELLTLSFRDVVVEREAAQSEGVRLALLRGEKIVPYERTFRHKSGREIPFEISANLIHDEQGRPLYFQTVLRDISERKRAERALAEERNLLRALIDTLPEFVYITDCGSRLILCNRSAYEQLALRSASGRVIGESPLNFFPKERAEEIIAEEGDIIASGQPLLDRELPAAYPTPNLEWTIISKVPFRDEQGNIAGLVVVQRNITESKKQEQERLQLALERQRFDLLNRFIKEAVSHDLRTPLTVMRTSLYLLNRVTEPDKRQKHLDALDAEITHFEALIENLLTVSRLYQPDLDLNPQPLDLNHLLEAVAAEKRAALAQRHQTLTFSPDTQLPQIRADRNAMEQAVKHLLSNAIFYTQEGGQISIWTERKDSLALIHVQDNGVGIHTSQLPFIFDPFFKVDKARTLSQNTGAGIGLTIAKRVVEAHGGQIEVQSAFGQGSTFTIQLPLNGEPGQMP